MENEADMAEQRRERSKGVHQNVKATAGERNPLSVGETVVRSRAQKAPIPEKQSGKRTENSGGKRSFEELTSP